MSEADKTTSFYNRLREQLAESTDWPSKYMFKFILPADDEKKVDFTEYF